ncbi:hypothetical protein RchiOBHm_Chr2g0156441 [Rosa chinensis]|uniref:Uncharacterized protein n=1 Tax=Rosa chinensis TaxID=74649 RepID=A0A2P6S1G9_ROSCH|nr:hypothetical protein RchiOBHm_Chr2g0156441 [Rosa chinensis]
MFSRELLSLWDSRPSPLTLLAFSTICLSGFCFSTCIPLLDLTFTTNFDYNLILIN